MAENVRAILLQQDEGEEEITETSGYVEVDVANGEGGDQVNIWFRESGREGNPCLELTASQARQLSTQLNDAAVEAAMPAEEVNQHG